MGLIPPEIDLLYIVRNPLDVMTSRHQETPRYITPKRWADEARALRALMEQGRDLTVVRFEDVIQTPDQVQERLAARYGLTIEERFSASRAQYGLSPQIQGAMHGARPLDVDAIGRYRNNPDDFAYLRKGAAGIGDDLAWFAEAFGYADEMENFLQTA